MRDLVDRNNNTIPQDEILQEVGEILISNTQKIRVLIVKDAITGHTRVSTQKWWRSSADGEWTIGKGFKLRKEQVCLLGQLLIDASTQM